MILRLRSNLAPEAIDSLLHLARELRWEVSFLDSGRTLAELHPLEERENRAGDRSHFEDLAVVVAVLDNADAPELHQTSGEGSAATVAIGEARFGAGHVALIAGPCAVEDRARLGEIARAVSAAGASVLRGGAFKPRTSPWAFQGLGSEGLTMLDEVRAETGLAVVTEVVDPRDVDRVAAVADALQIGSRSMANTPLLREAGRQDKPVLLKRGMAATLREFLLAAETVLAEGNPKVLLCERGVRSFDNTTRNLLDVGAIAHLKQVTHLPVIADPSHAAGRAELVRPLARAGLAAGADGLIVEVHPAPQEVHSDGAQALSFSAFEAIARDALALAAMDGRQLSRTRPQNPAPPQQATTHA